VLSVVAASTLAVTVFFGGPVLLDQLPSHRYLIWNLALAWVPFLAATGLRVIDRAQRRALTATLGVIWLLFLPNAPYLITDIAHFDGPSSSTPWLDLAKFLSFAWAGVVLGLASLRIVHQLVAQRRGQLAGALVVIVGATASGIGVAIGRFARLNSWEAVTHPVTVSASTLRLSSSYQAVAVGAFVTLLILVMYIAFGIGDQVNGAADPEPEPAIPR
jgi:uncharacterized membrane protein